MKTCRNYGFPAGFSWNVLIELLFISGVEQWVQVDGATIGSARRLQQKRGSRHVSCTWEDGLGGWALAAGFLPQNLDAGALRILKRFTNISPTSVLHQCCIIHHHQSSSGWWFQTFFYFPFHIWDVILPIDELIFFKMVKTTIELDDGKIYRKALYLMVKTMVSCRFSLKPIQWNHQPVMVLLRHFTIPGDGGLGRAVWTLLHPRQSGAVARCNAGAMPLPSEMPRD